MEMTFGEIILAQKEEKAGGVCVDCVDANGKKYYAWIDPKLLEPKPRKESKKNETNNKNI